MTINWNKVTCEEITYELVPAYLQLPSIDAGSPVITLGRTGEKMTLRQYMNRINREFMDQFAKDAKYPPW